MSNCEQGNSFETERQNYINTQMENISNLIKIAKSTRTPTGLTWNSVSPREQEEMLINARYGNTSLSKILNELINNNLISQKEISDLNIMIESKQTEINNNKKTISNIDSEITKLSNLELLSEAQETDSKIKYKNTERKYTILFSILIILILCEIGYVYFFLKSN